MKRPYEPPRVVDEDDVFLKLIQAGLREGSIAHARKRWGLTREEAAERVARADLEERRAIAERSRLEAEEEAQALRARAAVRRRWLPKWPWSRSPRAK